MLILLSPAKKISPITLAAQPSCQRPSFIEEIAQLSTELRHYSPEKLSKLMGISTTLSKLNYQRYQDFKASDFTEAASALALFQGDAYQSLDAATLTSQQLSWANNHLMILSGLYGVLKALDSIHPYRLEMKTQLRVEHYQNLYEFWGNKIANFLTAQMKATQSTSIINLASAEYAKAALVKNHDLPTIDVCFQDYKNGQYKTIGLLAKRARGALAREIIIHQPKNSNTIKSWSINGYQFNEDISSHNQWVFRRKS